MQNLQIKSLKKAKLLAKSISVIEEECGIHQVRITIKDIWVCPDINLNELNKTPTEILLKDLLIKISEK